MLSVLLLKYLTRQQALPLLSRAVPTAFHQYQDEAHRCMEAFMSTSRLILRDIPSTLHRQTHNRRHLNTLSLCSKAWMSRSILSSTNHDKVISRLLITITIHRIITMPNNGINAIHRSKSLPSANSRRTELVSTTCMARKSSSMIHQCNYQVVGSKAYRKLPRLTIRGVCSTRLHPYMLNFDRSFMGSSQYEDLVAC